MTLNEFNENNKEERKPQLKKSEYIQHKINEHVNKWTTEMNEMYSDTNTTEKKVVNRWINKAKKNIPLLAEASYREEENGSLSLLLIINEGSNYRIKYVHGAEKYKSEKEFMNVVRKRIEE